MGCEPCGVGAGVWPLESGADMNFDVGDSGKLGAVQDSSQHLLGKREGV